MNTEFPAHCDIAIRGGAVIDGTGGDRYPADVAVTNDRIVAIGELSSVVADTEIDAAGRAVAPGFIDVHTHDDGALLAMPDMAPKISQGVTTVIAGNCGFSMAPLQPRGPLAQEFRYLGEDTDYRFGTMGAYVAAFEASPATVNAALFGRPLHAQGRHHGRPRATGRGSGDRGHAGAVARRAGERRHRVQHRPGIPDQLGGHDGGDRSPSPRRWRQWGGVYATHFRDYVNDIDGAMEEAFEIGQRAGVQVHLSHHQADGSHNYGHTDRTLGLIDRARPGAGGRIGYLPLYRRRRIHPAGVRRGGRARDRHLVGSPPGARRPGPVGDRAALELQYKRGDRTPDTRRRELLSAGRRRTCARILAYPHTMIGSDALHFDKVPHPRLWGTFPRVLGHYARDLGLMTIEEAVRRMTSLPAGQFGFAGCGVLRPGAYADIVVFDTETVIDHATYEEPDQRAEGIELVMVNGRPVWRAGEPTGERPGRIVRREANLQPNS